ncbi:MAG: sialidase family protein [Acidimicrobiales bacterium]
MARRLGSFGGPQTRRLVAALAVAGGLLAGVVALPTTALAVSPAAWTSRAAIPSAETHAQAPALAAYDGLLYAVWAGQSSPYHLWYSAYNGTSWTAQAEIPSAITNYETGASLAVYDSKLYVMWQGASGYNIWYSTFNGSSWTAQTETTFQDFNSSIAGLAVYNGDLYLSWLNFSYGINYSDFNGSTWSAVATVPSAQSTNFESSDVPLAVLGSDLFVSWESSASALMYSFFNGTVWSTPASIGPLSDAGPALATKGSKLYASFMNYSTLKVSYAVYNGTAWKPAKNIPGTSYHVQTGPGIALYNGSIYVAWLPTFDPSPIDYVSTT